MLRFKYIGQAGGNAYTVVKNYHIQKYYESQADA